MVIIVIENYGKHLNNKTGQDKARHGKARQGKARQGKARQGKARQGKARQGKARRDKRVHCKANRAVVRWEEEEVKQII